MKYTKQEVMQFVDEEDVKFIRLAFCDVFGKQKNISIMPSELERAFTQGVAIDASAIIGFGSEVESDLFLHPDPDTLSVLPWRPEHGRVVRMYCTITRPDGTVFDRDTRSLLIRAVEAAKQAGVQFRFGSEIDFYLFRLDENGEPTSIPYDNAGYMDIAPQDKGENVRREICLALEQMGIHPEASHHEEGPGQNEIIFRASDPLSAADDAQTFMTVVRAIAARNGLWADFSPKPLGDKPGSGFHINISVSGADGVPSPAFLAGIMDRIESMTVFLNPVSASYRRLGHCKAPGYVSWGKQNRSLLIRVPAAFGAYRRAELRSADPSANPYLAFALLIYAGLDGIARGAELPAPAEVNFCTASEEVLAQFRKLPQSLEEAAEKAKNDPFLYAHLPTSLIEAYCG